MPLKNEGAHILLIASKHSYRVGAFMDAAVRLGVRPTLACEGLVSFPCEAVPTLPLKAMTQGDALDTIASLSVHDRVDAVIGLDDEVCELASRAARMLHLPGNDVDAVRRVGVKFEFRQALGGGVKS